MLRGEFDREFEEELVGELEGESESEAVQLPNTSILISGVLLLRILVASSSVIFQQRL